MLVAIMLAYKHAHGNTRLRYVRNLTRIQQDKLVAQRIINKWNSLRL